MWEISAGNTHINSNMDLGNNLCFHDPILKTNSIGQAYSICVSYRSLAEISAGVFNHKNIYKLLWSWGYMSLTSTKVCYFHIELMGAGLIKMMYISEFVYVLRQGSPLFFWHQGPITWRQFSMDQGWGGWFQADSRTWHLLCTLFLILCRHWSDRRWALVHGLQFGDLCLQGKQAWL